MGGRTGARRDARSNRRDANRATAARTNEPKTIRRGLNRSISNVTEPADTGESSSSAELGMSIWRNNSLSIVLVLLFVLTMAGQIVAGWFDRNEDARVHGEAAIGLTQYLGSGHFWEATGENWESEFLQMAMFVLLTVILRQKGSAESKRIAVVEDVDLDPRDFANDPEAPGPVRRGGFVLKLYENSLGLTFALLFLVSIAIHAAGGLAEYNEEQQAHGQSPATLVAYMTSARFWFESFQNWQSEFLSLAAMVVGTIYLRQRGSAESKPVHAGHSDTGR